MAAGSHCFVSLAVVAGPQCLLITPRRISALPYRRERCLLATAALSSSAAPTLPGFLKVVRGRESFEGPSVNLVLVSFSLHRRYMSLPRAPGIDSRRIAAVSPPQRPANYALFRSGFRQKTANC